MGKNNNIIEINGKRYDARTGAALSSGSTPAASRETAVIIKPAATAPAKPIPVHQPAAAKAGDPSAAKVRVHDAIRAPKHPASHQPQRSKTLMRSAVTKPGPGLKRHVKAHGHTDALIDKPAARLRPKASVRRLDDRRLRHARDTAKSQAVKRFSHAAGPAPQPPTQLPAPAHKPHQLMPDDRPVNTGKQPAKHQQTTADLLERALHNATSHELVFDEPASRRRRLPSKLASVSLVALGLVVLGGFVAYQNIGNVKLRIASSKAGFTASLPDYQPAGYHLGHLNAAPGEVAFDFHSNSDNRAYAITEKISDWNSDALRDGFLASNGQQFQTVETGGRTVFLYGQNAATWVNGGVWYRVQTNGTLSDRQLVQLASSM